VGANTAMTSSIRPGDHVVFRGLPASCKPTPLLVTNARDGQIELRNHGGWYKAALFEKVEVQECAVNPERS